MGGLEQKGLIKNSAIYMGVSKNNGTPKSSILIGFSIIFTIHFGGNTPYFWKHLYKLQITCPAILGLKGVHALPLFLEWCRTRWFSGLAISCFHIFCGGKIYDRSILVWQILALEFGKCITSEALDFCGYSYSISRYRSKRWLDFFGGGECTSDYMD